jgi:hypothetical protein
MASLLSARRRSYEASGSLGVDGHQYRVWGLTGIRGLVEIFLGVPAQQQPLETIARPLSAVAPLHKAAYSPSMLPSGTGTSAAA